VGTKKGSEDPFLSTTEMNRDDRSDPAQRREAAVIMFEIMFAGYSKEAVLSKYVYSC
jgi:hypothetical protein